MSDFDLLMDVATNPHWKEPKPKKMNKFDPKRKVWIVKPFEHGNGGWYGFKVLSSKKGMQLKRALSIKNPDEKYDCYNSSYNIKHAAIRICHKPDPNYDLYYFHSNDRIWYKS